MTNASIARENAARERAWIVRQGDAYRIDTNTMRCVAIFRPDKGNIMRGGEPRDPLVAAREYLAALRSTGVIVTDYEQE